MQNNFRTSLKSPDSLINHHRISYVAKFNGRQTLTEKLIKSQRAVNVCMLIQSLTLSTTTHSCIYLVLC